MSTATDFLMIEAGLTPEEADIRDTVARFASSELAPHINEWHDAGRVPRELAQRFGQLGVLGMHLDGPGCPDMSAVAYGLACRELEAVDSGIRSFVSVQGSLAMYAIHRWGSETQRASYLPRMAAGDVIGCFGLTEPDSGSDPGSMRTSARLDPSGDWILNGTKMWITNGTIADIAIVWARDHDGLVRGFVVPTDTPGFSATVIQRKLSLNASATAILNLDDVRLPAAALLPAAQGLSGPLSCLNEARFGILWGVVGAARTCFAEALDYSLVRRQFGRPLAAFQLSQRKIAEMAILVNNASLVAYHLGRTKDATRLSSAQVSYGKLHNVRAAAEVARIARGLLGAAGITLDHATMRHLVNMETVATYEGTEEIHALSIAGELTGIRSFR
ncbi:acyl-CoA dehydrogenase family protein [Actinomadura chibensis]|uniref:glutaryl-CoA dehydrogenase (ETF) n=1 Tax=Actinomadura chibensis TaxID=392828 RepID=A0A5D0NW41_9ACTN|nr:acyl-CoA dehydrogenase family protein [Actinomadura chibensis]TYB48221.1 acyl-CoA dehydrogenase [Actinomadura chibensis]